jgi:hypothetical protein
LSGKKLRRDGEARGRARNGREYRAAEEIVEAAHRDRRSRVVVYARRARFVGARGPVPLATAEAIDAAARDAKATIFLAPDEWSAPVIDAEDDRAGVVAALRLAAAYVSLKHARKALARTREGVTYAEHVEAQVRVKTWEERLTRAEASYELLATEARS